MLGKANEILLTKKFSPQRDITTYELAILFAALYPGEINPVMFNPQTWEEMPEYLRRHFRDETE